MRAVGLGWSTSFAISVAKAEPHQTIGYSAFYPPDFFELRPLGGTFLVDAIKYAYFGNKVTMTQAKMEEFFDNPSNFVNPSEWTSESQVRCWEAGGAGRFLSGSFDLHRRSGWLRAPPSIIPRAGRALNESVDTLQERLSESTIVSSPLRPPSVATKRSKYQLSG